MTTYAFIFARGGSKGVPGKNIKPLAGKPLIAYAIELAQSHKSIEKVFVSTDDADIADVARQYQAIVINRPSMLAQDNSAEWLAWQHAIEEVKQNYGGSAESTFISLPTTSPLRTIEDIDNALTRFAVGDADIVIGLTESARSPFFNMVKQNQDGSVGVVNGEQKFERRQDVPEVFDITTVAYVSSFQFIEKNKGLFAGKVAGFKVPAERAIDIDTQLDFKIAEFLMLERLNENA